MSRDDRIVLLTAPDDPEFEAWAEGLLGPADRARAARRRHPVGRRRTVISRGLLRVLAGELLGVEPSDVWTGTSPGGAPQAGEAEPEGGRPPRRLGISIAHTVSTVVVAASFSERRLGVDVELLDRRTRPEALARRYYAPGEAEELEALPAPRRPAAFLRAWTLKEAWGKAAGVGVPRALPLVGFSMGELAGSRALTARRLHFVDPAAASRAGDGWRFWTVAAGTASFGVVAGEISREPTDGERPLPLFAGSAMIERFDSGWPDPSGAPVEVFRMVSPPP